MVSYGSDLYVGTGLGWNSCNVFRMSGGGWVKAAEPSFGNLDDFEVSSLAVYAGGLYAGTTNRATGANMYRYNGTSWATVGTQGFGDGANTGFCSMYSAAPQEMDYIYVGTTNEATGCHVWQYVSGTGNLLT
jgi:hypothetical protein